MTETERSISWNNCVGDELGAVVVPGGHGGGGGGSL